MPDFTASDGAAIFYEDRGTGRPLVLLHGLMAHGGFYRDQSGLADRFRLITVDLRGHGRSQCGGSATVGRLADDVAELVEALDLRHGIAVGWSLGASVLWQLLSGRASPRLAGAVTIDMTPCVQNGRDWDLGLSAEHCALRSKAIATDFPTFAAAAGRAIFADSADRNSRKADWSAAEFGKNDPAAIGALWESLAAEDFRGALRSIVQPVLIVHGAHSHLYGRATADYLAATIPKARRIQFDQSGHTPHMEQPDLFNQVLTDFAASLPPVPQSHESVV